jgi:hypothetical protein
MYRMQDPSNRHNVRFCRLYSRLDGRPCTVVVDTMRADAYMFNYNYGPGRRPVIEHDQR